ncbi:MAG: hypothetical protein GY795_16275 [Desulfobacterales bacterium]|nr:hypothetical protein [Desulfobacterales bacterium]
MAEILQEPVTAEMPEISMIIAKDGIKADNHAEAGLKTLKQEDYTAPADRPGWIPPEITDDWDTNPYAYQTEEELMPAGGPHGEMLTYITEILRSYFKRNGMRYLADTFLLYRDNQGIRQRVAPDLLVMPFCSPAPSSYNLDSEPPPLAVAEITSPESRDNDLRDKVTLYTGFGITAYLVIDMFTPEEELRDQIELHLWRIIKKRVRKIQADAEGYLPIPEIRVKTKARGQNLIFADTESGEILCDTDQLWQRAEQEAELRKQETARAEQEAELRKQETARAEMEKQRAEILAAKLRELGITPDMND